MEKFIKENCAFTLIEILVTIAIIGTLAALLMPNVFISLKKSHDGRRKIDLQNIQKSLEMYYEDKRSYPGTTVLDLSRDKGKKLCSDGVQVQTCSVKTYMTIPADPISACNYYYVYYSSDSTNGEGYELYSGLEMGTADVGNGSGIYGNNCGTNCNPCRFKISSSNY